MTPVFPMFSAKLQPSKAFFAAFLLFFTAFSSVTAQQEVVTVEIVSLGTAELAARPSTLYAGVANPLQILLPKEYKSSVIIVKLNGDGTLNTKGNLMYEVTPQKPGSVEIIVYVEENNQQKAIGGKTFKVIETEKTGKNPATATDAPDTPAAAAAELKNPHDPIIKGADKVSVVSNNPNNFLYLDIDNYLELSVHGYDSTKCTARFIGDGKMTGEYGKYHIRVNKPGPVTIEIIYNDHDTLKLLTNKGYEAKRMPDPIPHFANKKSGQISREDLKKGTALQLINPTVHFDPGFKVLSYSFSVLPKEGEQTHFQVKGADLPPAALRAIKDMPKGPATLFFDDIIIQLPGEAKTRSIKSLVLDVE